MIARCLRVFLLALALIPALAAAGPLDRARDEIAAGRPDSALRILAEADDARVADPLERRFLLGLALIEAGRPEEAAALLGALLAQRPGLTRVRLELARALFLSGRDEAAARQFRQVLGGDLPPPVRQNVLTFLEQIDGRRRWSGSVRAGIAPDTNISRGTGSESITLFGQRFDLSDETRRTSGIGFEAAGDVRRIFGQPGQQLRPVVSASVLLREYANDGFDDHSVSLGAGVERLIEGGSLYAGPRVARRWFGGEPESDTVGLELRGQRRLGPRLLGFGAVFAGQRQDLRVEDRDPTLFLNTVAGLSRPLTAQSTLTGRLGLRREIAEPEWDSLTRLSAEAAFSTELPRGFRVTVTPGFAYEFRDEENPLLQAHEDKRVYRGEVRVSNRLISFLGLSPAVSLELTHQEGEVVLDDYDRARLLFSVESTF